MKCNHVPSKRMQNHITSIAFLAKNAPSESSHKETLDKPNWKDTPQNTSHIIFNRALAMKVEDWGNVPD